MDPDANLTEQLAIAQSLLDIDNGTPAEPDEIERAAVRLAELVLTLNEWIANNGRLPKDWQASWRRPTYKDVPR